MPTDNHWSLDKRIPISVIILLIANMIGGVVYATKLDARVASLEKITENNVNAKISERLTAVETQIGLQREATQHGLNEIQKSLREINKELRNR